MTRPPVFWGNNAFVPIFIKPAIDNGTFIKIIPEYVIIIIIRNIYIVIDVIFGLPEIELIACYSFSNTIQFGINY